MKFDLRPPVGATCKPNLSTKPEHNIDGDGSFVTKSSQAINSLVRGRYCLLLLLIRSLARRLHSSSYPNT